MFATKHSASSSGTSIPETERAVWNIDIGIRVPFPVATHLRREKERKVVSYIWPTSIIPEKEEMTYTRRNKPRRQSSRAFSRESHKFSWSKRGSHLSRASSYPWTSPILIAAIKGENISSRTGKRRKSSFEGRWPFKIRSGIKYAKMRLKQDLLINEIIKNIIIMVVRFIRTPGYYEHRRDSYKKRVSVPVQTYICIRGLELAEKE